VWRATCTMLRRRRTPAFLTIANIAFRTFESSSVVPADEGKTNPGIGRPVRNHAARSWRRQSLNTALSCCDKSTFRPNPLFGVVI
jgi:hypothetical protein